jgi:hypothetical protein
MLGARQFFRLDIAAGPAQRVSLGFATAFGHGLSEVGEDHREPQPQRNGENKTRRSFAVANQRLEEQERCQHAPDLDYKHHGIFHLMPGVELGE